MPSILNSNTRHRPRLSKEAQTRALALLVFGDPMPWQCAQLRHLSRSQWKRLLYWLDTSGLALYFLARLALLSRLDWLPGPVLARLERNLADNTARTGAMQKECVAIQAEFENADIHYALLKGFSLWPSAVASPELRSQLDLDFLVAEGHMDAARRILEGMGYRLHAISGRSWEFKTSYLPSMSIRDLYKDHPGRCVELHAEAEQPGTDSLLARVERRILLGFSTPVLPPVDLFLGQALHLFKHVCSESFRCAHMIEFRREVLSHRNDAAFWNHVRARIGNRQRERLALGLVTLLATDAIGPFAPAALTSWTVDCLPASIRLWVDTHGLRCVAQGFPGSKLYLLLQRELEAEGIVPKRAARRALIPLHLPPAISRGQASDLLALRLRRTMKQLHYIRLRLRFHIVEGFRYAWELQCWQRRIRRLAE